MSHSSAIPNGTVLANDYRIERVLGAGGFGITYLADEMALQRQVTIKEYFPTDFAARANALEAVPRSENSGADFQWGLDRFIEEAQTLARFDHRNIVKVYRYFRANSTGYMVLQFEEGQSLKLWAKSLGRAPRQREVDDILAPLLDALQVVHAADFLHRDIAPDNIIVRKDGSPVLIDFGSARGEIAQHSRTLSALVKPGYSPYEQYSETGHRQGPWTDIYALGATLYWLVSGKRPPDAPSRVVKDDCPPVGEVALSSYRPGFLRAIDRALAIDTTRRPQSILAWRGDLLAPDPAPARVGWLRRAEPDQEAPAEEMVAAGSLAGALAAAMPPVPDAPAPKGKFLDFVDGLKRPAEAAPAGGTFPLPRSARAPVVAAPSSDKQASKRDVPAERPAPAAKVPSAAAAAAEARAVDAPSKSRQIVVATPRPAPRPRPTRRGFRLSPLLFKLAVGAAVAGAVVAFQDRLPRWETRSAATATSQSGDILLLGQFEGHPGGTSAVAYSDDGRAIVTTGVDASLKVWSSASGSLLRRITLDAGPATTLAVSGNRAVTGHADGVLAVWDIDDGRRIATLKRNEANIWSVTFAGGPGRVLASSHDWSVALWDLRSPAAPMHVFEGHGSAAQAVAFSPAGSFVASGGADRLVKLWSAQSLSQIRTYRGHKDFITALGFSRDGSQIASGDLGGAIRLSSTRSGTLRRTLSGHKGRIAGLVFTPDGEHLVSGGDDGTVRIWDHKRGRSLRTYGGGGPSVRAIAVSPDGRRIAAGSEDGPVRIWSASVPATKRSGGDE